MDAKTLCLAALSIGEASGYDVKKLLDEPPFSHFQDTGFGSIYPALTWLAHEGLVEVTPQAQSKRPDKKVYGLTAAGRDALNERLSVMPAPDKVRSDFLFALFMSDLMPRAHVARVIDQRIAECDAKLTRMADCEHEVTGRGHRFCFELGRAYYRFVRDYLARNKDWLVSETDEQPDPARLVAE